MNCYICGGYLLSKDDHKVNQKNFHKNCWNRLNRTQQGEIMARSLFEIAREIRKDWKNVYFGAKPYLDAMTCLDSIKDNYGQNSGNSIVCYFLCNAQTWKGETARRIKKELKDMLK